MYSTSRSLGSDPVRLHCWCESTLSMWPSVCTTQKGRSPLPGELSHRACDLELQGLAVMLPTPTETAGGLNFPKVQEISYGAKRGDNSGSLGRGELFPWGVQQLHSLLGKTSSFNFRLDLNRITLGCETFMNMEQQERIIGKRQPRWLSGLIVRYTTLDPTSEVKRQRDFILFLTWSFSNHYLKLDILRTLGGFKNKSELTLGGSGKWAGSTALPVVGEIFALWRWTQPKINLTSTRSKLLQPVFSGC